MNKFLFEKYLISNRGTEFKGYVSVHASDAHEAAQLAQHKAGADMKLQQVYINPADDYAR